LRPTYTGFFDGRVVVGETRAFVVVVGCVASEISTYVRILANRQTASSIKQIVRPDVHVVFDDNVLRPHNAARPIDIDRALTFALKAKSDTAQVNSHPTEDELYAFYEPHSLRFCWG
jgi:hypothetical protein